MIKIASEEDLPLLHEMSLKFGEASPYKDLVNQQTIKDVVSDIVRGDNNSTLALMFEDKGMLLGITSKFLFGDRKLATEVAWWVEPEHRKSKIGPQLLEYFEYWAKVVGCTMVTMISIDDTLGKYYEKQGYTLTERSYMKVI